MDGEPRLSGKLGVEFSSGRVRAQFDRFGQSLDGLSCEGISIWVMIGVLCWIPVPRGRIWSVIGVEDILLDF